MRKLCFFTIGLTIISFMNCQQAKPNKVLYEELTPKEFRERIKQAPIAYLPLGTIEWHGEHLPLGSDGIISHEFFELLAQEVGGIVLPMLFLGPDRVLEVEGKVLYGMDTGNYESTEGHFYEPQQLDGSAYWVSDSFFKDMMDAILKQLARAGFRIVVGHGHGPSSHMFRENIDQWKQKFGLQCFLCWGSVHDREGLGIMVDHAAMNETSLLMAMRSELVQMENLPADLEEWPLGVGGRDPRIYASVRMGRKAIDLQLERMKKVLTKALLEDDS